MQYRAWAGSPSASGTMSPTLFRELGRADHGQERQWRPVLAASAQATVELRLDQQRQEFEQAENCRSRLRGGCTRSCKLLRLYAHRGVAIRPLSL
jgi:hypothetical protein